MTEKQEVMTCSWASARWCQRVDNKGVERMDTHCQPYDVLNKLASRRCISFIWKRCSRRRNMLHPFPV